MFRSAMRCRAVRARSEEAGCDAGARPTGQLRTGLRGIQKLAGVTEWNHLREQWVRDPSGGSETQNDQSAGTAEGLEYRLQLQ
jgi:hypothetical protein